MSLGSFSVSLAVSDLDASRKFYETLGFEVAGGEPDNDWLILRNGTTTIGLFQGMFDANILTFNPGWDGEANALERFEDIREIQARLDAGGIELMTRANPDSTGPAAVVLQDPDGNTIMFDQHVPKPS